MFTEIVNPADLPELWLRVLSNDGEILRGVLPLRVIESLEPEEQGLLRGAVLVDKRLDFHLSGAVEDWDTDPEHNYDHEDWFIFRRSARESHLSLVTS